MIVMLIGWVVTSVGLAAGWRRAARRATHSEQLLALRQEIDAAHSDATIHDMLDRVRSMGSPEQLDAVCGFAAHRIAVLDALASSSDEAATDALTGAWNRRHLTSQAEMLGADDALYSVAIADLDFFKALNDTYGHDRGDDALIAFAHALQLAVGERDSVCRFGGEEFVILLPGQTQGHAREAMERARAFLRAEVQHRDLPDITASFGLAESTMADDFDAVLQLADQALLRAKREGRDRVIAASRPGRYHEVIRRAA